MAGENLAEEGLEMEPRIEYQVGTFTANICVQVWCNYARLCAIHAVSGSRGAPTPF